MATLSRERLASLGNDPYSGLGKVFDTMSKMTVSSKSFYPAKDLTKGDLDHFPSPFDQKYSSSAIGLNRKIGKDLATMGKTYSDIRNSKKQIDNAQLQIVQ